MLLEGSIQRQAAERVSHLRFSQDGQLLAAQSAGKVLELFRYDPVVPAAMPDITAQASCHLMTFCLGLCKIKYLLRKRTC